MSNLSCQFFTSLNTTLIAILYQIYTTLKPIHQTGSLQPVTWTLTFPIGTSQAQAEAPVMLTKPMGFQIRGSQDLRAPIPVSDRPASPKSLNFGGSLFSNAMHVLKMKGGANLNPS